MARQRSLQSAPIPSLFLIILFLASGYTTNARAQLIVAHRGASYDAPENTLAAFKLAWEQNADAIEGDFHLTSDQQIVCIHDKDTNRVSSKNLVVAETTLAELRKLDVSSWKSSQFAGERIPTLAEVLHIVPVGKQIFIEIKCGPEIVPLLYHDLKNCSLEPQQLIVISFNRDVIHAMKQLMPKLRTYWVYSLKEIAGTGETIPPASELVDQAAALGAAGLDLRVPLKDRGRLSQVFTSEFRQRAASKGLELHAWTIDDPQLAQETAALGFRSLTTNRPILIRQALLTPDAGASVGGE